MQSRRCQEYISHTNRINRAFISLCNACVTRVGEDKQLKFIIIAHNNMIIDDQRASCLHKHKYPFVCDMR